VRAVLSGVTDIVDGIDSGCQQAERDERQRYPHRHIVVSEGASGAGSSDDQHVLDPLPRPGSRDQGW
jgi:hypothetical protein